MLNRLIRFSLEQRALILVLAVVLLVFGVKKALEMPVDVLPDLTKPTVTLLTEAKGYAPEEVETLVTIPLENALMGVTGVDRIRSTNDIGLSLVFVEFDWGTDIYKARQFVQERLMGAGATLPEGVSPYMAPVTSLMGDIMLVGLRDPSGEASPRELREIADWVVARRLQSIKGIAEVLSMGGGVKQLQVQPDPQRMLLHRITFEELRDAAAEAVANTTGGFLTDRPEEIMVRNLAMSTSPEVIGETVVVHRNDRPIHIRDVADVVWDIEPMRGDAAFGVAGREPDAEGNLSHRGVILSVRKSPGFDTLELDGQVLAALEELEDSLPGGAELVPLYRQSDFIELSIGNLEEALRDGSIMVAVILFLFLLNFRITLITLTAIPLSLGITILVFDLLDLGVNSMTLGGLAVAVGMVVDDAIVDVENVFRRLRENAARPEPLSKLEVIARASSEVRSSILYATVLIILVFIPLMALSGLEGRLFTPIAIATIVSMAASFVVSLTVIPVLSSFLLNPAPGRRHEDFILVRWLKAGFRATWMRLALSQPLVVVGVTLALAVLSWGAYRAMGRNFLPAFREPTALVATTLSPGTSLKMTTELSDVAQEQLLRIPGVKSVGYRAGRAERGDHVVPVSSVEFDVEFDESAGRTHAEIVDDIRHTMKGIPGTFSAMSGPLADRIGHMLSGVSAKVAVKVFGPELGELRRIGEEIAEVAHDIPGLEEARLEQQAAVPQLRIEPDPERAAAYAVTPGALTGEMASLMGGETVAEAYRGERVYELVVRLPEEWPVGAARIGGEPEDGQRAECHPAGEHPQALRGLHQPDGRRPGRGGRPAEAGGVREGRPAGRLHHLLRGRVPGAEGGGPDHRRHVGADPAGRRGPAVLVLPQHGLRAAGTDDHPGLADRGGALHRLDAEQREHRHAGRLHRGGRDRGAQQHHAALALPPPDEARGRGLQRGDGHPGHRGAAGSDPDDRAGRGLRAGAAGDRGRGAGQGDPQPGGHCDRRRSAQLDPARPGGDAGPVLPLLPWRGPASDRTGRRGRRMSALRGDESREATPRGGWIGPEGHHNGARGQGAPRRGPGWESGGHGGPEGRDTGPRDPSGRRDSLLPHPGPMVPGSALTTFGPLERGRRATRNARRRPTKPGPGRAVVAGRRDQRAFIASGLIPSRLSMPSIICR